MTFDDLNLNTPLLSALNNLGYTNPTTIQRKVFSVVMSGRDVCGIAQTGTGKTFSRAVSADGSRLNRNTESDQDFLTLIDDSPVHRYSFRQKKV